MRSVRNLFVAAAVLGALSGCGRVAHTTSPTSLPTDPGPGPATTAAPPASTGSTLEPGTTSLRPSSTSSSSASSSSSSSSSTNSSTTKATTGEQVNAQKFATPTGNIGCYLGDKLVCWIAEISFTPPPKPPTCEGLWGHQFVVGGGAPRIECSHDADLSGQRVKYGTTVVNGANRCEVAEAGVTCKNASGGFFVAKERYALG